MQQLGKVLLVDDDSIHNFLSARTLRRTGAAAHIAEAGNGREALGLVEQESFDLILLDVSMPVMNGVSFLDKLQRLQEATAFTPPAVVLLTASERYLGSDRALGHPLVRGAMTKPLTRDDVNYLIGLAMDGNQANTAA